MADREIFLLALLGSWVLMWVVGFSMAKKWHGKAIISLMAFAVVFIIGGAKLSALHQGYLADPATLSPKKTYRTICGTSCAKGYAALVQADRQSSIRACLFSEPPPPSFTVQKTGWLFWRKAFPVPSAKEK